MSSFVGGWWAIFIMGSIFFFIGVSAFIGVNKHYKTNRRLSIEGKECNNGQVHNVRQWVTVSRNSNGRSRTTYHYAANVEYVAQSGDKNLLVSTTEYAFDVGRFNQLYAVSQANGGVLRNVPLRYFETDLTQFLLEDDLVPFRKSETYCEYLTGYMCAAVIVYCIIIAAGAAMIIGGFFIPGASVVGCIVALLVGSTCAGGLGICVFPNYCKTQLLPTPRAVQFVSVGLEVQAPPLPVVAVAIPQPIVMQSVPMTVPPGQVQMVQQPYVANQMQMQNQNQYVPQQQQQYTQQQQYNPQQQQYNPQQQQQYNPQQQQYNPQQQQQYNPQQQQQQYTPQQYTQQQYTQQQYTQPQYDQQQQYNQSLYGQQQTNM